MGDVVFIFHYFFFFQLNFAFVDSQSVLARLEDDKRVNDPLVVRPQYATDALVIAALDSQPDGYRCPLPFT